MTAPLALLLLLATACGSDDPCAGVRDLATSPGGLTLTKEEHALGWSKTECFQCHQAWAIHRADCSSFADSGALVNLEEVAEAVDVDDTTSCVPCHGANGVKGWDAYLTADDDTGEQRR